MTEDEMEELRFLLILSKMKENAEKLQPQEKEVYEQQKLRACNKTA
jgi:hypothetical protein